MTDINTLRLHAKMDQIRARNDRQAQTEAGA